MLDWKSLDDFYKSKDLYKNVGLAIRILLSTAYLEFFHALFGLVKSNPTIVFVQVFARFIVVLGVVHHFKDVNLKIYLYKMFF